MFRTPESPSLAPLLPSFTLLRAASCMSNVRSMMGMDKSKRVRDGFEGMWKVREGEGEREGEGKRRQWGRLKGRGRDISLYAQGY